MAEAFATIAARQLKTSAGKSDSRRKLIIAVRAASKRLGLEDDDRKAIQLEITGKPSMADMTLGEIGQVLDRLNRDRTSDGSVGGVAGTYNPARAHIGKVRALWWTLYWLGEIDTPNDAALDAFVTRQTGIASLRFLDHRHAPSVIEALKSIASRAGVRWPTPAKTAEITAHNPSFTLALYDRHWVIEALWTRLYDAKLVYGGSAHEYLRASMSLAVNQWRWNAHELDGAIRLLGKKWRGHLAKAARVKANDR